MEEVLYYQNVRGLNSKTNLLLPLISLLIYDIICFTETWLTDGFNSSEIFPSDKYSVYRKDRNRGLTGKDSGGGVLIAIKNKKHLNVQRLYSFERPELEMVWLRIGYETPIYLCCTYLPQRSIYAHYNNFLKSLQDNVAAISLQDKEYNILICGDFNLPSIDWALQSNGSLSPVNYLLNDLHGTNTDFVHTMSCFELSQFNHHRNSNGRILDLVLSDLPSSKISCHEPLLVLCPIIDSNHPPVQLSLDIRKQQHLPPIDHPRYNFPVGDYRSINNFLGEVPWETELSGPVDEMVARFYEIVMIFISNFVPKKKRRDPRYPVWFSRALIISLGRKKSLHKQWKRTKNNDTYKEFSRLRNKVKMMAWRCFHQFVGMVEENMKGYIKEFWKFTKSLKRTNTYPTNMRYNIGNGVLESDNSEGIANLFGAFFQSVYSSDSGHDPDFPPKANCSFAKLSFSPKQVEDVLVQLDTNKGAGDDGISNHFLVETAAKISLPLSIIFNASLSSGIFPTTFKNTIIHPIFKSGNQNDVENYRPIAILNATAKVFEKLVHKAVLFHVLPYLNETQHGFLPKKSTVTNLIEYVSYVAAALDRREQVDAIYLDLSKAFDKVSHRILHARLRSFGFTGPMLSWFVSYLSNRHLTVAFNGFKSEPFIPASGVGQGSILGPLLFVLYIDDLTETCSSFKLLYADDCKLARIIHTADDVAALQNDLNHINSWCENNTLPLNPSKCSSMTITNKVSNVVQSSYSLGNGTIIPSLNSTKDLGVIIDSKLKYNEHVDRVANKAFKSLGFLIRTCRHFISYDAALLLYSTLVLPHLEYAATIWSPYYSVNVESIEKVQRRFTRFVYRRYRIPYSDYHSRLKRLGLLSLTKRRTLNDQMILYDIIHGRTSIRSSIINISYRTDRSTRNQQLFYENTWRINSAYSAPVPRMVRAYNRNFNHIDIFNLSKTSYKNEVYDAILSMPD